MKMELVQGEGGRRGGIHPRKRIAFNSTNIQALPQKHSPMVLSNTPTSCHRLLLLTVTILIIPNDLEAAIYFYFFPSRLVSSWSVGLFLADQKTTPARGAGVAQCAADAWRESKRGEAFLQQPAPSNTTETSRDVMRGENLLVCNQLMRCRLKIVWGM